MMMMMMRRKMKGDLKEKKRNEGRWLVRDCLGCRNSKEECHRGWDVSHQRYAPMEKMRDRDRDRDRWDNDTERREEKRECNDDNAR